MPNPLDEYKISSTKWRETIRQNKLRSRIVIGLFFLIYLSIGLLIDTYLYSNTYPNAPLSAILTALVQFRLFPIATIVMLIIAAVSLLISYAMHNRLMLLGTDYREVTEKSQGSDRQLYNIIEELKIAAGLAYMPRIFIIDADYMNAFASGFSEKSAMVAITRGLMQKLNRDELQAVMAHELSHIRHLDIKLTLTATLLANLSIMALDILFYQALFSSNRRSNNSKGQNGLLAAIMILRYLLPLISVLLLFYLSRKREFMADAGCVELTRNNQPLAHALMKIHQDHCSNHEIYQDSYSQTPHENLRQSAYIYSPKDAGIRLISSFNELFSTHPSIAQRLDALGFSKRRQHD